MREAGDTQAAAQFARVEAAIEAVRAGRFVLLTDDEGRENEGDLVMAAQFATPEAINFMAAKARGLICLAMDATLIDRLSLAPMVSTNETSLGTAFTVSIGAKHGITTGISAFDRAHTVQVAIREGATRDDLVVPGHLFPLRAREGGVLVRAGHTEGSVDLARLAGLRPAGVICEVLKEDGSMARRSDLEIFARDQGLVLLSIEDLIHYRLHHDASLVQEDGVALSRFEMMGRPVEVRSFRSLLDGSEILAWIVGHEDRLGEQECLVRVHTDAGREQLLEAVASGRSHPLHRALARIAEYGNGVLLSLPSTLETSSQDGNATRDRTAGFVPETLRRYGVGAQILRLLGVRRMHLLTSNPKRLVGLHAFGLEQLSSVAFDAAT
jgi:3,4-dihydroxy 2-butanone 4-phosphate synthase/GTP cyclohydrolase II